jgi:hypothetical protein
VKILNSVSDSIPIVFTLEASLFPQYLSSLEYYMKRPRTVIRDYFSAKSVHAFSSYVIVDLGHNNIRFFVLQDYQVFEKSALGFGGLSISQFFMQLIKENKKNFTGSNHGFVLTFKKFIFVAVGTEISKEKVCQVAVGNTLKV